MSLRIGVTGGRDYTNWTAITHALGQLPADAVLVHGDAHGVDRLCAEWWHEIHDRPHEPHPADWKRYGAQAGPIRNQEMIDSGLDLLVVFPGGRGTADMTNRAERAGVPILPVIP